MTTPFPPAPVENEVGPLPAPPPEPLFAVAACPFVLPGTLGLGPLVTEPPAPALPGAGIPICPVPEPPPAYATDEPDIE